MFLFTFSLIFSQFLFFCPIFAQNDCPLHGQWSTTHRNLFVPSLTDLSNVTNLRNFFAYVNVSIIPCPDLRQEPYSLAQSGFGGKTRLIEVGSSSYLVPLVNRSKIYDLGDLVQLSQLDNGYVFGPGGGPWPDIGTNGEGIYSYNFNIFQNCTIHQQSQVALVDESSLNGRRLVNIGQESRILAVTASLFVSSGLQTNVIKMRLQQRTNDSFELTHGIKEILAEHYGTESTVGLGIIFLVRRGVSSIQIQPNFSETPLETRDEFLNWVHYFNISSPLVGIGTIITNDLGLNLFTPHFHVRNHEGDGGHWRHDVSPDIVDYEVLINIGEALFRIDAP